MTTIAIDIWVIVTHSDPPYPCVHACHERAMEHAAALGASIEDVSRMQSSPHMNHRWPDHSLSYRRATLRITGL